LTAPPKAITPVALSSVAGIDEKMHEDREESKAEIQLGQKSVIQIDTSKNWQAVSDRNKRLYMMKLFGIEPTTSSLRILKADDSGVLLKTTE